MKIRGFAVLAAGALFIAPALAWADYVQVESQVARRDYAGAAAGLAGLPLTKQSQDEVLSLMERGFLLHLQGQYAESNRLLAEADRKIDALFTKSVTGEVGAMFTNDLSLPYEGEDFEKVMVNLVSALNWTYLGNFENAAVEARKVNEKLAYYNTKYPQKSQYDEDAFADYLAGIVFEGQGETNDSLVMYKRALKAYGIYEQTYGTPVPGQLKRDLLRVLKRMGENEDYVALARQYPDLVPQADSPSGYGDLVFISYDGLSPLKKEALFNVPVPVEGVPYQMRIAFPRFVPRAMPVSAAQVNVVGPDGSAVSTQSFEVQNITAIGEKNLQDRIGRIKAKAIASAVLKFAAVKLAEKQVKDRLGSLPFGSMASMFVGAAGNAAANATAKIDDRSWRLLPGDIHMARLSAPAGVYRVEVTYLDKAGNPLGQRSFDKVNLAAGRIAFLHDRFSPAAGFDVQYRPTIASMANPDAVDEPAAATANDEEDDDDAAPAAHAAPVYGAIAVGIDDDNRFGWSANQPKAEDAQKAALGYCGENCKPIKVFQECGAYASSAAAWGWGTAHQQRDAAAFAVKSCRANDPNGACAVVVAACNKSSPSS